VIRFAASPVRLVALLLPFARPVAAQIPDIRGYTLSLGLWSDRSTFDPGGLTGIQRLRLMAEPSTGPLRLEVAWEHVVSYAERAGGNALLGGIVVPGGGEWLDLEWKVGSSEHSSWTHRLDRLNLNYSAGGNIEVTAGRQTISWATTLLLTPADPFQPFDPSDPFREYRAGVDALRVQVFPGPLSELEFVLRPADTAAGTTLTALARGRTTVSGWEVSGWTGALHDHASLSLAASGALGGTAVRFESVVADIDEHATARATVGVDHLFQAGGRDLYLALEYQHDGYGARDGEDLGRVVGSTPFLEGQLQTLSRDVAVAQASYQLHPLVSVASLVLSSLNDGSALISPSASWSVTGDLTASAGLFLGAGRSKPAAPAVLASEFGGVPAIVYLSLSAFF